MSKDIRWIQRFQNFKKSFAQLERFLDRTELNELEEQGLIQSFEYNHELAWKVQKDFLEAQGVLELYGSKNVAREAFKVGLINNADIWLKMIEARNLSSHTYNEETKNKILKSIIEDFFEAFLSIKNKFELLEKDYLSE
ncbi:MAG: nucleotidyltransferase [Candidatus Cloacimonadota bacterium]|nr:MAG: nucleotidyltransferase [Candidatus Cloacimonadota bacterium]